MARVRAEKMKEIDGVPHRWCAYFKKYFPLSDFNSRVPRPGQGDPSESAKYQSDSRQGTAARMAESRARRRGETKA